MDRQIKFRAWHPDENRHFYFKDFREISEWQNSDEYRHENSEYAFVTFEQFTNLIDVNGIEIYEGDIVQVSGWKPATVGFVFGSFKAMRPDKNGIMHWQKIKPYCKVIGNIHENYELLKEAR